VARKRYWDLYTDCAHLDPEVPALAYSEQDPHSQRLMDANDYQNFNITPENIRRSRQAYFANLSYLDDKIGDLLQTLKDTRQEAIVVFLSDHGDMLGERGMWFKMSFREGASRVPLMIAAPGLPAGQHRHARLHHRPPPDLADLAGIDLSGIAPWTDGQSLVPLAQGTPRQTPVAMEYAAEGTVSPMVGLTQDAGNTSAAPPTPTNSSTCPPTRTNPPTSRQTPPTPPPSPSSERQPTPAGTSPASTRTCAQAKPGAGSSTRAPQRAILPVGLPAAAKGVRALHAQPHGPQHPRGLQTFPPGRMTPIGPEAP
jgi:hypothetical protein